MARLNHVKSFRGTTKTADGNLTCERCREPIKPGDRASPTDSRRTCPTSRWLRSSGQ